MNAPIRSYRRGKKGKAAVELVPEKSILDRLHNDYLKKPPTSAAANKVMVQYVAQMALLEELTARIRRLTADITKTGLKRNDVRTSMGKLARQMVQAFGQGPIQIEGVVYDFGFSGEQVFLRARRRKGEK